MRVLMVHNYYKDKGGEDRVFELEKTLLERFGHQVYTFVKRNYFIDEKSQIGKIHTFFESLWAKESYKSLVEILNEKKYKELGELTQ